jgi:hypothetical protein
MVNEVFETNFDEGLKALAKIVREKSYFSTSGRIYADEVILCVSLMHEDRMAATSIYASVDYDAAASAPTMQDLLAACVDAVGAIFGQILDPAQPETLEAVAHESLSALENIPFEWTEIPIERYKVFVKIDKANPMLEQMADDWLAKNDPDQVSSQAEEEKATESLFVTGPKNRGNA